jgi:hypothetical protein
MEMLKVREIYKHNIYGVIATLSFHVVLLIVLITSDLKYGNQPPGEAVLVDFSLREFIMPDPETNKEPDAKSGTEQQLTSTSGQQASNQAVNEASRLSSRTNDPFFDKAYINEVAAAKKLVSDVNKTLAKNILEIGDIRMPEENSEGKTREEAKQSNFKGKSNIHYFLENRYHQRLPIPVYLAEGAGEVIVDIVVGRSGQVLGANPRYNPKITDLTIFAYAKQAAEKTWFNEDMSAPEKQAGTITYRFVAQ